MRQRCGARATLAHPGIHAQTVRVPPPTRAVTASSLTTWSLGALALGLALGALGHGAGGRAATGFAALAALVGPLGDLWVNALQLTVLPLVVTHLLAAVVCSGDRDDMAALGGRALLLFLGMLVAAGVLAVLLVPPLAALYEPTAVTLDALRATPVPDAARAAATAAPDSLGAFVSGLLPRNLFEAAARGELLPLLLFTIVFAAAVTRLPDAQREPLARTVAGLAAAMLQVVRWVLWLTPLGVFAFTYGLALRAGGGAAGMLGAYVAVLSVAMLVGTALLYPLTAIFGRVRVRDFARAAAPAQLVAASTRSSLAALPALVEGARERLRLPPSATGFVLPLSAALFKPNRTISSTGKLIFLAHVYGVPLGAATLVGFVATVILLSVTAVGVPGGGSAFKTMPAYLAAGIPIEGVVIAEAVETIPDVFKTLLNVTGYLSVATLLSRGARAGAAPVAEEAPAHAA